MEAKHTKGPWAFDADPDGLEYTVHNGVYAVASCSGPEAFNDAALIAAAPDYAVACDEALAALYGAREVLGRIGNIQHAIDLLEAARAKAALSRATPPSEGRSNP